MNSKIHTPNPTLEKRKGGREEGREGTRERGEACVLSRQRERATKREWVRGYLCPLTLELKDKGNGSTQSIKHKHDSSKTEAGLDTVMPEAKRKPGAKQSRNSMHFPLTSATLTICMHSQIPVHNKFLVLSKLKQFSPLFDH